MSPKPDWLRVVALYRAALGQPAEERAAFVRDACANDAALRAQVDSLLAAHPQAAGFLERSGTTLPDDTRSEPGPPRGHFGEGRFETGRRVGAYRIVRLLGRGGMGEVYEAEHVEHGRRVALKVLSERLTNPRDRIRFLREGQLAASVNHPNVVYIYGSDDIDGTPIIAMELLAGGTLKDRVRDQGPLPPREAADAILQVIGGLEAAWEGGILHRDVKPANCFIDRDGRVKIGDFGLSISTAPDATQLTTAGTIRGTPHFAAPEQLNGQMLDLRADIYAVGATFYYLITGQPPFDDREILTLLSRVATEAPRSPREIVPAVPRGLAAIVLRCLAKDPRARFATYGELRKAVAPFGSTASVAAPIGARFAAALFDQLFVLFFLAAALGVARAISRNPIAGGDAYPLLLALCMATYYAATEGIGGASFGKRIFGLCVTDVDGTTPGLLRILWRSAIFVLAAAAPYLIPTMVWARALLPDESLDISRRGEAIGTIYPVVMAVHWLAPLVLFFTARRRHGFAGLHEILSGTRVGTRRSDVADDSSSAARFEYTAFQGGTAAGLAMRGPYLLCERLASAEHEVLWLGFDPVLERHVWIREKPAGAPVADARRRDLSRRGRLRWLTGRQEPTGTWEAFEAPRGASLQALGATRPPWRVVRGWLADLADELVHLEDNGHAPAPSPHHVWITADRAMLLDFPAPGTSIRDTAAPPEPVSGSGRAQTLLRGVAASALSVSPPAASLPPRVRPPLPPAGSALLRRLFDPDPSSPEDLRELCRRAMQTPTSVPRWTRALLLVLIVIPLASGAVTITSLRVAIEQPLTIGVDSNDQALFNGLILIERLRRAGVPESDPERRALEIYVAGRHRPLTTRAASFAGPLRPFRDLALEIGGRHPAVSDVDLLAAIDQLGRPRLDDLNRQSLVDPVRALVLLPALALPVLAGVGLVSMFLAFALRGGLTFTLFRLVLIDSTGEEVGRWRALSRAVLAWAPLFVLVPLADRLVMAVAVPSPGVWATAGAACLLMITGLCWAIAAPERGMHEKLTATWLVPR
jgi:hypothetical protein